MFDFLNSLFTQSGFNKVVYDEIVRLTNPTGPFHLVADLKGEAIYGYLSDTGKDQSHDPNYDDYKNSKIFIYDDLNKTVEKNLGDKMLERHLKNDILNFIRLDFEDTLKMIVESSIEGKDISKIINVVASEIEFLKKEFSKIDWLNNKEYILDAINEIENTIIKKYGKFIKRISDANKEATSVQILRWHGSLSKLCSLFYFISKENYQDSKINFFINAPRKEIEEFIHLHFVDNNGYQYPKDQITKIFNPNNDDRRPVELKKYVKNLPELPDSLE